MSAEEKEYWEARASGELSGSVPPPPTPVAEVPEAEGPPPLSQAAAASQTAAAEWAQEGQGPGSAYSVEDALLDRFEPGGLIFTGNTGGIEVLPFTRVRGVAVAGIKAGERPFLVLDLLLHDEGDESGVVVRFRSQDLNPNRAIGNDDISSVAAFRELVRRIASAASAPVLPRHDVVQGKPFATFQTLEEYEEQVLAAHA